MSEAHIERIEELSTMEMFDETKANGIKTIYYRPAPYIDPNGVSWNAPVEEVPHTTQRVYDLLSKGYRFHK